MNNSRLNVIAIVEGGTELAFVREILAPYLSYKNIWMAATEITKKGQKGGDVRFSRVKNDIIKHLKQRDDTVVTLFVDYYGIKEWPGKDMIPSGAAPSSISSIMKKETLRELENETGEELLKRFIPFFMIHEFEALLFSDADALSSGIHVKKEKIDAILNRFHHEPERINNNENTAPFKRIATLMPTYKKKTNGISIAADIGIDVMRGKCPIFNEWITQIESFI